MIRPGWRPSRDLAAMLAAIVATLHVATAMAAEPGRERCYGIAKAGQNEGLDDRDAPGSSTTDFQGNAWVWVPAGECLTVSLPVAPDGSRRRGALEPLERDRP